MQKKFVIKNRAKIPPQVLAEFEAHILAKLAPTKMPAVVQLRLPKALI